MIRYQNNPLEYIIGLDFKTYDDWTDDLLRKGN